MKRIFNLFMALLIVNLLCVPMLTQIVSAATVDVEETFLYENFDNFTTTDVPTGEKSFGIAPADPSVLAGMNVGTTGFYFETMTHTGSTPATTNLVLSSNSGSLTNFNGKLLRMRRNGGYNAHSLRKPLTKKIDFTKDAAQDGIKDLISENDNYKIVMSVKALAAPNSTATDSGSRGIQFYIAPQDSIMLPLLVSNVPPVNDNTLFSFRTYTITRDNVAHVEVSRKNPTTGNLEWKKVLSLTGTDYTNFNTKLHDFKVELVIKEDGTFKNVVRFYVDDLVNPIEIDANADIDMIKIPELYNANGTPYVDPKERGTIDNLGSLYMAINNGSNSNYVYVDDLVIKGVHTETQAVSKTALGEAISAATPISEGFVVGRQIGEYAPEIIKPFNDALENAVRVSADDSASQTTVDEAEGILAALVLNPPAVNTMVLKKGGIIDNWDFSTMPAGVVETDNVRFLEESNLYGTDSSVFRQISGGTNFSLSESSAYHANHGNNLILEGVPATLFADFDIMFDSIVADGGKVEFGFIQNGLTGSPNYDYSYCTAIEFDGANERINIKAADMSESGYIYTTSFPLVDGKWYNIRQAAYLTRMNGLTPEVWRRSNIWVDGQIARSSNFSSASSTASKVLSIDNMYLRIIDTNGANATPVNIDNLKIYKQNRFAPEEYANKGGLITALRNADELYQDIINGDYTIGYAAGEYLPVVASAVTNAFEAAEAIYEGSDFVIQANVNSAITALNTAVTNFVKNGNPITNGSTKFYMADGTTEIFSLADADDALVIKRTVAANANANEDTAVTMVALYKYEGTVGDTSNITLVDAAVSNKLVLTGASASGGNVLTATIPLTGYTDKSKLFVKSFLWENGDASLKPLSIVMPVLPAVAP